jgi:hypothetical protein
MSLKSAGEPVAVQLLVIDDQDGGLRRVHVAPTRTGYDGLEALSRVQIPCREWAP